MFSITHNCQLRSADLWPLEADMSAEYLSKVSTFIRAWSYRKEQRSLKIFLNPDCFSPGDGPDAIHHHEVIIHPLVDLIGVLWCVTN